ncbi:MAG: hypothetical protein K2J08_09440 [Ruminococcus sp.]|nr:hypothetical protein [Ruminococcus sp.]
MNKKSKKALKNAFDIPEPTRKESFFNNLETPHRKNFMPFLRAYLPAVITAVVVIGVWNGVKNLPHIDFPETTDKIYTDEKFYTTETKSAYYTISTTTTEKSEIKTTVYTNSVTTSSAVISATPTATQTTVAEESPRTENVTATRKSETADITEFSEYYEYIEETHEFSVTQTARTTRQTVITRTTTTTRNTPSAQIPTATTTSPAQFENTDTSAKTTNLVPNIVATTTACHEDENKVTTETVPSVTVVPPPDLTVNPPVRYHLTDSPVIDIEEPSNDGLGGSDKPSTDEDNIVTTWEKLAIKSDLIVIATVYEVIFTGIDGKPYTQENIMIDKVIKGDIPENSRISVYVDGGYIPFEDYSGDIKDDMINNFISPGCMLFDKGGNKTLANKGDTFLYFIKKNDGTYPDGSYFATTRTDMSKYQKTGDFYTNLNRETMTLYLSELIEFIKEDSL